MARKHGSNRSGNRRQGYQVVPSYSYEGCMIRNVTELNSAMDQRSRHRPTAEQSPVEGNMRSLLRQLEEGEVIYKDERAIPAALTNKQPTMLTTLRIFYNLTEYTWVIRHETTERYVWEVNYVCKDNAFSMFRICSCDTVTAVR